MANEFFELNQQISEDKVISREQRIYADTLVIPPFFDEHDDLLKYVKDVNKEVTDFDTYISSYTGTTLSELDTYLKEFTDFDELAKYMLEPFEIITTSFAPMQKIKFFVDVLSNFDVVNDEELFYRIGRYYEVDPTEVIQIGNSSGYYDMAYTCEEVTTGKYKWQLSVSQVPDKYVTLYISSVVFEDSFYNPTNGWLNPDNPDNLADKIVKEVNEGLPAGADPKEFLVVNASSEPEWQEGKLVVEYLPKAGKTQTGVVRPDDVTIKADASGVLTGVTSTALKIGMVKPDDTTIKVDANGTINVPKATATQLGVVKVDNSTIVAEADGTIKAIGGGGGGGGALLHYTTSEQDTGLKWIDGKNVYQKTFVNPTNNSNIFPVNTVDHVIEIQGTGTTASGEDCIASNGVLLARKLPSAGHPVQITWSIYSSVNFVTVRYTKI